MNKEEFIEHGHAIVDWIANYLNADEHLPVLSKVSPGEIRSRLPPSPPVVGEPFETIFSDFETILMPGVTHWQDPSFFAYFPSNVSEPSILGELLSAGLGVQGMLWSTSPACTELETHVLDWFVNLLGLPSKFLSTETGGGVIQDTASSATLCAVLAARERASSLATNRFGVDAPMTAYASSQAHSSIEKAIRIAGLGSEQLRLVPVDIDFAMQPAALEKSIIADRESGYIPTFVCAAVGSTSSMAIDPVPTIADICKRQGVWLHVDAAMAGPAALCPEFRWLHEGVDLADSYCFNPHKWMLTNFDCDCFYVADRNALIQTLSILPEYLRNRATDAGAVIDYRDWQIPLGRRFRALKLWFVMRSYGVHGIQSMIRRHIELAEQFEVLATADDRFELAAPRRLNLVCFRHRAGDEANARIMAAVNDSGRAFLTHTKLDGKLTLRVCVGQRKTEERHVARLWQLIADSASAVS